MHRIVRNSRVVTAMAVLFFVGMRGRQAEAALLLGQPMNLEGAFPDLNTIVYNSGPFTVGAGTEVTVSNDDPVTSFSLDVADTSATFTFPEASTFVNASFDGYILQETSLTTPQFTSISIDSSTTFAGVDSSPVSFDARDVFINLEGLNGNVGDRITLDFVPVPEPASASLCMIGGLWLLVARRRRPLAVGSSRLPLAQ